MKKASLLIIYSGLLLPSFTAYGAAKKTYTKHLGATTAEEDQSRINKIITRKNQAKQNKANPNIGIGILPKGKEQQLRGKAMVEGKGHTKQTDEPDFKPGKRQFPGESSKEHKEQQLRGKKMVEGRHHTDTTKQVEPRGRAMVKGKHHTDTTKELDSKPGIRTYQQPAAKGIIPGLYDKEKASIAQHIEGHRFLTDAAKELFQKNLVVNNNDQIELANPEEASNEKLQYLLNTANSFRDFTINLDKDYSHTSVEKTQFEIIEFLNERLTPQELTPSMSPEKNARILSNALNVAFTLTKKETAIQHKQDDEIVAVQEQLDREKAQLLHLAKKSASRLLKQHSAHIETLSLQYLSDLKNGANTLSIDQLEELLQFIGSNYTNLLDKHATTIQRAYRKHSTQPNWLTD